MESLCLFNFGLRARIKNISKIKQSNLFKHFLRILKMALEWLKRPSSSLSLIFTTVLLSTYYFVSTGSLFVFKTTLKNQAW